MAVVARNLWLRHNAFVYGIEISPAIMVVGCAVELMEAFQAANYRKDEVATKVLINNLIWEAPNNGFVKVNWNAIVDKNKRKMGVGVLVRDGMGEALATLSSPRDYITEPDINC
jgi:hypothetical protein